MSKTTGMLHYLFCELYSCLLIKFVSYTSQEDMLMRPTDTISTSHSPPPHSPVTPSNEPSSGAPVYSEVNRTTEFSSNGSTGVYCETNSSIVRYDAMK